MNKLQIIILSIHISQPSKFLASKVVAPIGIALYDTYYCNEGTLHNPLQQYDRQVTICF